MVKLVLDSDVIIDYLRTGKGALPVVLGLQEKGEAEACISTVTVMEILAGESVVGEKRKNLDALVNELRVVSFDREVAALCADLKRGRKLQIALADLIIAATAVSLAGKLVTRNRKHFVGIEGVGFWRES